MNRGETRTDSSEDPEGFQNPQRRHTSIVLGKCRGAARGDAHGVTAKGGGDTFWKRE